MAISSFKNILHPGFVGRTFKSGYRIQRHWNTPMATAFFCGETGAGLFLVSMLLDFLPGIMLGLLITGVGKTFFHLTHMGVPGRSWRAILRPDRSWISRGLWGIIFFIGFGLIHVFGPMLGILPDALRPVVSFLAMAGALLVLVYQGFAMSHSSAIALWNTGLMPISSMLYGLLAGVSIILGLHAFGFTVADISALLMAQKILVGVLLLTLFSLLHGAKHGTKAGQQSYELLTRGYLARPFLYGVIGIGTMVPLLLVFFAPVNFITTLVTLGAILIGFCLYRLVIFKAGVLSPIFDPANGFIR